MRGCIDCKHHKSELDWDLVREGVSPCTKHTCLIGNNDIMNRWWVDNGYKISDFIAPVCAEQPDAIKSLDRMIDLTKKMTELVKNSK